MNYRARPRSRVILLAGLAVVALVAPLALAASYFFPRKAEREGWDRAQQTPTVTAPLTVPPSPAQTGDGSLSNLGHTWAMPAYKQFYDQRISWTKCPGRDDIRCAGIKVPMDWTDPGNGKTVEIRLAMRPAERAKERIGSIVYDPGGPGGSGTDFVMQSTVLSDNLARRYDVVGIDPRGVTQSTAVDCLNDAEMDSWVSVNYRPWTNDGFQQAVQASKTFAQKCRERTGELLNYVDTWSASRDLDIIRAALGEDKLHYMGASYGTLLGAEYARFYPEKVGRFVLDGALDPRMDSSQVTLAQARAFEKALRAYAEACLRGDTGDCPLRGSPDEAVKQVRDLISRVDTQPMKPRHGNRELTAPMAVTGLITPLYDDQSWYILSQALAQALKNDPTTLMYLSDGYNDRDDNGRYRGNSMEAFVAINCSDYPTTTDKAAMDADAKALEAASPTFGKWMAYGDITCSQMQLSKRAPTAIAAEGAGPIVVVGTVGDPATPYEGSQALAAQLKSGTLLTYDGQGHTAYNRASSCIDDAVDAYFVSGKVPAAGTRCK